MAFDDAARLRALREYGVLDTEPEESFDNIVALASRIFDAPIVLVSLVDETRQWFKARVGMDLVQTPREWAFCDHAIRQREPLVVSDASADDRFVDNPLVTGAPHLRFYCGVPLRTPEGHALGTLCLLDRRARTMAPRDLVMLQVLARQVEVELQLRWHLARLGDAIEDQRQHQRDKELLASMVVHDMRGPLTGIVALGSVITPADLAAREDLDDLMGEAHRLQRMMTDVLDLCLQEVGGLSLRRREVPLQQLFVAVERSVRRVAGRKAQSVVLDLPAEPVTATVDPDVFERVLTNLISNAVHHGPRDREISCALRRLPDAVRVEVRDHGPTIPPELRDAIFRPFQRTELSAHRGYGLGLAFCSMAVEAHGGTITVEAGDNGGNCFAFELPTS